MVASMAEARHVGQTSVRSPYEEGTSCRPQVMQFAISFSVVQYICNLKSTIVQLAASTAGISSATVRVLTFALVTKATEAITMALPVRM